jgi:uncharacterized protein YoxC
MTYVLYILWAIVTVVAIYIAWVGHKKTAVLESWLSKLATQLYEVQIKVHHANQIIKKADIRGAFESDDEVGDAFKIIQQSLEILEKDITNWETTTDGE